MIAYDFEYDGLTLSSLGYTICKFGSDKMQTVSNGSQINFNTVSSNYGAREDLLSAEYSDCLEATFEICKNQCSSDSMEITIEELRFLMRWLNRKSFKKLKLISDIEKMNYYFEASFNINKIELDNKIIGLELEMKTNRPFALMENRIITIKNLTSNGNKEISCESDEEGFIYPKVQITLNDSGTLTIYNASEQRTTRIENCLSGETITMDYPIITSSEESHDIQNDFNWKFFRLSNEYKNRINKLTISLACEIKIIYTPIAKISV